MVKIEFPLETAAIARLVIAQDGRSVEFRLTSPAGALAVYLTHEQIDVLRDQMSELHQTVDVERVYNALPTHGTLSAIEIALRAGVTGKAARINLLRLRRQYRVWETSPNRWTRDQTECLDADPLVAITLLIKGAAGKRVLEDAIYDACPTASADEIHNHIRFLYQADLIRQDNGDITGYAWKT